MSQTEFKIPIIDLTRQYKSIRVMIREAIDNVFDSADFILGPAVESFEKEIGAYCECNYAVGVASGTDALLLALLSLGIEPGDEVITTPFTFIATASAICHAGARPVFVDIDPNTFNIDADAIESSLNSKTKAILPVHLFGQPAEMQKIILLAQMYDLVVIEDAAQSLGARFNGKPVGSLGDAGILSFFPSKTLGGYGDGGAIITNRHDVAETVDILRRQGGRVKYIHDRVGYNSRLDSLQAAMLQVKLRYLDHWVDSRRIVARKYTELLRDFDFILPVEQSSKRHAYNQYSILVPERRDELQQYLRKCGIQTMIYYPKGLHAQPAFSHLGYSPEHFPNTETVCNRIISLPCFPEMEIEEIETVAQALKSFYR